MSAPDELSALLKSWTHTPPAAPDFARQVHARLAESAASASDPGRRSTRSWFWRRAAGERVFGQAFPLAASLALVFSAAVGSGLAVAYTKATHDVRMVEAYARTIDPLKMVEHR